MLIHAPLFWHPCGTEAQSLSRLKFHTNSSSSRRSTSWTSPRPSLDIFYWWVFLDITTADKVFASLRSPSPWSEGGVQKYRGYYGGGMVGLGSMRLVDITVWNWIATTWLSLGRLSRSEQGPRVEVPIQRPHRVDDVPTARSSSLEAPPRGLRPHSLEAPPRGLRPHSEVLISGGPTAWTTSPAPRSSTRPP